MLYEVITVSYGGTLDEFDAETKLIVDAKAARCETVNGTRMLVHQRNNFV